MARSGGEVAGMIGVAVLGAGFMGATHLRAWAAHPERARVVTVLSRSLDKAGRLAATVGARPTTRLEEAIGAEGVDVVDICLPTPVHRSAADAAFAAGRHVLVEKPVALTVDDAEAMQAAALRAGAVLQVGHVLRFWPEYEELHAVVSAGTIGRPRTVLARRLSAPPDWADWFADPAQSGGVAVDLMIHDFDQANALLGRPLTARAWALGSRRHVLARVQHEHGDAWIEGSAAMPVGFPFESSIEVLAEGGLARHRFVSEPSADEGNLGPTALATGVSVHAAGEQPSLRPVRPVDAWASQAEHFLDAVSGRHQVERGTPEQAVTALRVALAVNRSLESARAEVVHEHDASLPTPPP